MLNEKSYRDITISDVCSHCGIARTTFYRLFDTLDDVLLYQFDGLFETGIIQYRSGNASAHTYAYILLSIALSDRSLITALIASGRTDLFDFSTRLKTPQLLHDMGLMLEETNRQYCTAMLNAMLLSIVKVWVENGCCEPVGMLYERLKSDLTLIWNNL